MYNVPPHYCLLGPRDLIVNLDVLLSRVAITSRVQGVLYTNVSPILPAFITKCSVGKGWVFSLYEEGLQPAVTKQVPERGSMGGSLRF